MPEYTADVDGLGTLRLLDAIRSTGLTKTVRFYQVFFLCTILIISRPLLVNFTEEFTKSQLTKTLPSIHVLLMVV